MDDIVLEYYEVTGININSCAYIDKDGDLLKIKGDGSMIWVLDNDSTVRYKHLENLQWCKLGEYLKLYRPELSEDKRLALELKYG